MNRLIELGDDLHMTWQFSAPAGTEVVSLDEAGAAGLMVVKLRSTSPIDLACPHCGGPRTKNGTRIVRFRDIPTACGQAVVIDWLRQKFVCSLCHRSSHDQHAAFDRRRDMTVRFVEWVGKEAAERGFTAVAKQTSINPKVARRAFRETEKKLGADVGLLSDAIAIELIDLAGCKRPAIIDARGEFVFEVYVSSQDMQTRLPAFASDYLRQHEHPMVVADLSLFPGNEGTPRLLDEAFGPQVERLISRASLEREVVHRIWGLCEPLLDQKYPDRHTWRSVRAVFFRRRSSMKKIARRHLQVWEKMLQPELYAAYMLKEDFLDIWQGQAKSFSEDRFDAWIQRAVRHSNLRLDALVFMMLSHRRQILAFSRYDFLDGFYKRLSAITSLDKNRSARSFSAARAALLMRGLSKEREKLNELVGQFADELMATGKI
ncbi:transposase [Bradyrhizobium sp. JYMT SZCCT0180]|uniref:transposase n=1 Tax=Bradyrhizobium sp. JYMT SZCCT0180 TaxID=2807666 RepID=UPI001BAD4380|nr:transposase [Bradyrhizobium sp. JYMT SZCCT0180]MBR1214596.1 ISL3 family transposase [Bradyrhizobium sp. JYMT SZCCT0180]